MDHEQHKMSEHRETANADLYQVIPRSFEDIASGRVEETRSFCEKERKSTMLPQAIRHFIWSNAWLVCPPRTSCKSKDSAANLHQPQHGFAALS
ncbi:MAG: hypothetical protein ACLFVO_06890 [Chloroflexaceae bacterium]